MNEKRKYPRHILEGMGVYARTVLNQEVEIVDISLSGASVKSGKRFNIGGQYMFRFTHKSSEVSLKGVVVWEKMSGIEKISADEARPIYTAGIEFVQDAQEKTALLKEFIADHLAVIKERRLSGIRVNLRDEKGILVALKTCTVSDISQGGMRIELDQEPVLDAVLDVELSLSENEKPLRCEGRVVYFHEIPDETSRKYGVGIEFGAMGDAEKNQLDHFIETLS